MIRVWRYADGFEALEQPTPELSGDQILVEVEAAVVGAGEIAGAPTYLGGAAVGRVVAEGGAAGHLLGARVAVGRHQPCGECERCRRALVEGCQQGAVLGGKKAGTLASHLVARARWVLPLEDELAVPGAHAALIAGPAALAYAMFGRAGVAPGEPVVVVGGGPIGRFLEAVARARGARPYPLAAQALTEPLPALRPLRIFETSGSAAGRAGALKLTNAGATLTFLAGVEAAAVNGEPLRLDLALAHAATVHGVGSAHPDLFPEVAALSVRGDLDLVGAMDLCERAEIGSLLERCGRAHDAGTAVVVARP
jgi:threonine dehydrogenase-like Zn-dependent dehydrogenase